MKIALKSNIYYSAYPLKAVEKAVIAAKEGNPSPYLKALLSGADKPPSRLRVTPMVNPYKENTPPTTPRPTPSRNIEPEGKEWFNHYE